MKHLFRRLFADHVHMGLQHDRRCVFVTRGSGLFYHNIIKGVCIIPKAALLGESNHVFAEGFFLKGRMRNIAEFLEIFVMGFAGIKHIVHGGIILSIHIYNVQRII